MTQLQHLLRKLNTSCFNEDESEKE